jgi:hypothetical protein
MRNGKFRWGSGIPVADRKKSGVGKPRSPIPVKIPERYKDTILPEWNSGTCFRGFF